MEILGGNQDTLSRQIKKTFNFINLTYTETDTNMLLLRSLQKDIFQTNSTIHYLSKELKALFSQQNSFIIMFQLRSHLVTLCKGIHSVKIDTLSILNHLSYKLSKTHTCFTKPLRSYITTYQTRNPIGITPQISLTSMEW